MSLVEIGETLEIENPEAFGEWLAANGAEKTEIWVLIYKKTSGKQTFAYEDLVEQGIGHGWIDSMIRGVDDERYAQRFTPRRKNSIWTEKNRATARRLIREGRMTEAGKATLPEDILAEYETLASGPE